MEPLNRRIVWRIKDVDTLLGCESGVTLYWYGLEGEGC